MHDCRATGKLGEYLFLCSRCGRCYVCRHEFKYFEEPGVWRVRHLVNGKYSDVIFDGRLQDGNHMPDPGGLFVIRSTDESLIDKALKDLQENGDPFEKQATKGFNGKEWLIIFPHQELPIRYSPGLS